MQSCLLFMVVILSGCLNSSIRKETILSENGSIEKEIIFQIVDDDEAKKKELEYYPSGAKKSLYHFKDGVKEGAFFLWYENGEVQQRGVIMSGKYLIDSLISYYSNGQIKEIYVFDKSGKKKYNTSYYESGVKSSEASYKDGDIYGTWYLWYDNGQVEVESNDTLHKEWYRDGTPMVMGQIKNGAKSGSWQHWNKSGRLEKEVNYKFGLAVDSVIYPK